MTIRRRLACIRSQKTRILFPLLNYHIKIYLFEDNYRWTYILYVIVKIFLMRCFEIEFPLLDIKNHLLIFKY